MSSLRPRVGVLGAGQLALMLAQAAERLGVEVICAGSAGDCASRVAPLMEVDLDRPDAVQAFAATVDVVTIESENIDAAVLPHLNLYPNSHAVGIAQERLLEKRFFRDCGIGTAPFAPVDSPGDFPAALAVTGLPAILKTRRMGYDGKGQFRLTDASEAHAAWQAVGAVPCLLEGMVRFDAEVSLIAARSRNGETVFYPLIQNFHREGILRMSIAPYDSPALQRLAEGYVSTLLQKLDYVGVLAVEFFVVGEALFANEMAPRVHNSGHWTIEGAATSQFENHLRAILDMPLGPTDSKPMAMLNCIGRMPATDAVAPESQVMRHAYGKDARAGRKVGHLTLPAADAAGIRAWQRELDAE